MCQHEKLFGMAVGMGKFGQLLQCRDCPQEFIMKAGKKIPVSDEEIDRMIDTLWPVKWWLK